jgi:hypothetical protein
MILPDSKRCIKIADFLSKIMQNKRWQPIVFLFFTLILSSTLIAQGQSSDSGSMQSLLQSKSYTFTAQYAQPLSGRQVALTSTYTLTVTNDSLICDLPYYGRAYVAPMNPAEGGLNFISNHFDYEVMPAKRGRYTVSIKIKDRSAVNQMYLNVSKKGYASLQVTPVNKQAISYYGVVKDNKAGTK